MIRFSSLTAPPRLCSRRRSITPSTGVGIRVAAGFRIRAMSASASSKPAMAQCEAQDLKLLDAVYDDYGGVVLEGKRGVWIKLPIEHANLVEVAVKEGFWYHHAEPSYLMLVYWIPDAPHTLPPNASHRVGVGAFVINNKREVLVVQEKSGIARGTGLWKFPTGVVSEVSALNRGPFHCKWHRMWCVSASALLSPGEDICSAAVREVKEETAINTRFVEVLAFRQSHKAFYEKSDLYFICQLEPLSFDIQKEESEIETAVWMPFEEYASQPFGKKHELLKFMVEICKAKIDKDYSGFSPVPTSSAFSKEKSFLYLNHHGLNN